MIYVHEHIRNSDLHKILFICGIGSSFLYPLTDIIAGTLYKGYSFNEQAVSELFAIGAPTAGLVVPLFTVCSLLLIAFGWGVWLSASNSRLLRLLAIMIWANGLDSLVLWIFFPMHMRGVSPTFTDTMHIVLSINPFVLFSIVLGAIYYRNWFRYYSIGTILLLVITAIMAFSFTPLVVTNQPTPGLGINERVAQYTHQLWHAVLAFTLLRNNIVHRL